MQSSTTGGSAQSVHLRRSRDRLGDPIVRPRHRALLARGFHARRTVSLPTTPPSSPPVHPPQACSASPTGIDSPTRRVARSTIAKVLKELGIKPSPDRPMSWATFVRSHAKIIVGADFFTTEVWTARGLVTYYTLFLIDIARRRVHIAGTTTNPTSAWMEQIARNVTDCDTGFLAGKRYLIIDRDAIFSPRFKSILNGFGVEILVTAFQAPNMNAYAERFVRSIKSGCLRQMILVGQGSLDRALAEFVAHYHDERSHVLTSALVIKQLPPWHENLKKRQVKSPKVYLADSGLLHTLLNLNTMRDLESHPKLGASWEGFVIREALLRLGARRKECFFWGTHAGAELDLLVIRGRQRVGVEIKRTASPRLTKSMQTAMEDLRLSRLHVIHAGDETFPMARGITAVPLGKLHEDLKPLS